MQELIVIPFFGIDVCVKEEGTIVIVGDKPTTISDGNGVIDNKNNIVYCTKNDYEELKKRAFNG